MLCPEESCYGFLKTFDEHYKVFQCERCKAYFSLGRKIPAEELFA